MNIVHSGNTFQVYGDSLKTYAKLPVGSYDLCFSKMQGFFLTSRNDLVVNEEKIYGSHEQRVAKILRSYARVDRNFGVLLSGPKGVGKSMFARILANDAAKMGYPLINVSGYVPGIADFLSSIEQEVVVLFDEFEKTFAPHDGCNPQEEMLSLFDGIDGGKKLFVVTVNEVSKLSTYLINRPGRFHYHFLLTNPTATEVAEYMTDKLLPEYSHLVNPVVAFSQIADPTYDVLRAIAFELNQGYTLNDSLADLNITKESSPYFRITVYFEDGGIAEEIDHVALYSDNWRRLWFQDARVPTNTFRMDFKPCDANIDVSKGIITLDPSKVIRSIDWDDFDHITDDEKRDSAIEATKNRPIQKITFERVIYGATVNKYSLAI